MRPLKATNNVHNPKDEDVRACGRGKKKRDDVHALTHARWTGCVGVKVDIKSLLTRLSSVVLCDPPRLLPCSCLTPATQGFGESSMPSTRDMTSSLSPGSPPLLFGCNLFGCVTACSKEASTTAQNKAFVLMMVGPVDLFSLVLALMCRWWCDGWTCCVHALPYVVLWVFPVRWYQKIWEIGQRVCHKQESSPLTLHQCQSTHNNTCQKQDTLLIKLNKQGWLSSCRELGERRRGLLLMRLVGFVLKCICVAESVQLALVDSDWIKIYIGSHKKVSPKITIKPKTCKT